MPGRSTGLGCIALGVLVLAGCPHRDPWPLSGDGGPPDATVVPDPPDAKVDPGRVDARPGDDRDAAVPGECEIRMNLGELGLLDGQATAYVNSTGVGPDLISFVAQLDDDPKPDIVSLELYKGFGAFSTSEITTGSFPLTGVELNYATCGVCVTVFTNYDPGTGESSKRYFQTGGIVQLSSVSGNLTGSLEGVRMEHVTINPMTFETTPVNDGCVTGINTATFDAPIMISP